MPEPAAFRRFCFVSNCCDRTAVLQSRASASRLRGFGLGRARRPIAVGPRHRRKRPCAEGRRTGDNPRRQQRNDGLTNPGAEARRTTSPAVTSDDTPGRPTGTPQPDPARRDHDHRCGR